MAGGRNSVHSSELVEGSVSIAFDPSGCRMREGELSVERGRPNPLAHALSDARDCNPSERQTHSEKPGV